MTELEEITQAWTTIERVLAEHLPEVLPTLRPGASDATIARLEHEVGPLPEALIASLRIHDGQDNPTRLLDVYDHLTFLSVDAMLEDHQMRIDVHGDDVDSTDYSWMTPDRVRTIPNSRGWLRFTDSEGLGHVVDLDPLPNGERGQVIWWPVDGPTPVPVAQSYGAWLTDLARRLEAGEFTVDEEEGLWLDPEATT
ncbi:SMI1/KNR4 family protein [Plantibacter flavus]|uniref:SMI1/KNR4 family protein n=1 Tax=Plantibacter flavus TaxID=150123 RepID=UPI003F153992